jgi:N-acetylated-alpha-linked acidic dipeptidase
MLRELTASPRLAGTSGSRWSADLVARWLEDAGWKVEIDEREVMLSLPRSIALTVFDSAFSDQPMIEHIDRFDPDAIPPGDLPKCNAWSKSGDVRGLVVDAGYGLRADFERLKTLGVDVRGTIALIRYGHSYRGIKVDLATQYGCSGVLLFDDPAEDGPDRGPTWPAGPWKPDWDAQRGSISPMGHIPGDPSTPGWASGKHGDASVKRVDKKELDDALPRIPCIPIGSRDARAIQAKLGQVETKDKDQKTNVERLGPGPVQAHLVVDQPRDLRTIHNVIARLPGESEECVIAGAHRDAWVRGANDDGAGTVLMLRAAQHLGGRALAGWKPKSTILLCLWDAEEFGMIGSTEWGEANAEWLKRNAIAYVNADTGVGGPHFRGASGTPGLLGALKDVLQRVPAAPAADGTTSKTLWDEWHDAVQSRSQDKTAEPRLSLPGSGSDFAVFLHHLSLPVLQFGFGDSESGQYHTTFDDFLVVDRYIDPGFVGHEIAGQFVAELLSELAQRGRASFSPGEAAAELARRAREAADDAAPEAHPAVPGDAGASAAGAGAAPDPSAPPVDPAPERLAKGLRLVSEKLELLSAAIGTQASASAAAQSSGAATPGPAARAPTSAFYSALALPEGLPGRPWYKNRLWTPGLEDGYGSETFPTLRSAAKESDAALEREAESLIRAIEHLRAEIAGR